MNKVIMWVGIVGIGIWLYNGFKSNDTNQNKPKLK